MTGSTREEFTTPKLYPLVDAPPVEPKPPSKKYYEKVPIGIDLGSWQTRVGYCSFDDPGYVFPTITSKYRDRRINKTYNFVGNDCYIDSSTRSGIRTLCDGALISNWDVLENILDYSFYKLGVSSENMVDNPIVMTEPVACPYAQRANMQEVLFESYGVPSAAFGIDSLFSYYKNNMNNDTGMVVSLGNEATHVIPVVNGKGVLSSAKRINWGGHSASRYLSNLLALKYPQFPSKLTSIQAMLLLKEHCYVSQDYNNELDHYLDWDQLDKNDRIIQAPFTEVQSNQKSQQEIDRLSQRRKESGRKLQEQAQKARTQRLAEREQEYAYYKQVQERIGNASNSREEKEILSSEGFQQESELTGAMKNLEKAIKRSRKQDVNNEEPEEDEVPTFPLIDIPDDQLNEEQIKEKRHQRLMKGNYDARIRMKGEKEKERNRIKEQERLDEEKRRTKFPEWLEERRQQRRVLLGKIKEKERLRKELSNRKSHASQLRMRSIASLASDDAGGRKRRRDGGGGNNEDTFGADDDDWAVYRDIANLSDSEEEEEMQNNFTKLEKELLEYDPEFTNENLLENENDWRKSILYKFLRGTRPFDSESQAQQRQIHLNIERIKVPEVLFEPSIAGIDQAGIIEVTADSLLQSPTKKIMERAINNVFITGGFSLLNGFETRFHNDLQSLIPIQYKLNIHMANDALFDSWRGMANWINSIDGKNSLITREMYNEMGPGYIKEHGLSNV